jgi:lysophospholipase L1-like esterase
MTARPGKDILFLGDSLIEYFDWEGRFPAHRVRNLGISGETVEWLLERVPRIVQAHARADMVFIMTGINNVAMEETGIIAPYREVVALLTKAYPGAPVFIHSLLPTLLPFLGPETITSMNEKLEDLAAETGTRFLDVHSSFAGDGLARLLSPDGIHVSEAGYAVWSGIVEKAMESA